MKYTITCWGEHKYPLWKPYEMLSPNCSFTMEMNDEELSELGWFDAVVKKLTKKVEDYLDWKNPDLEENNELPFKLELSNSLNYLDLFKSFMLWQTIQYKQKIEHFF